MDINNLNPIDIWLILAALLFVIDVFVTGGIGLVFGGLAALATAFLIYIGLLDSDAELLQMAAALTLTTLFGALLWKPLKKWRLNPTLENNITNVIGDTATVVNGSLKKGVVGRVKWSGTVMHAELDAAATGDELPEGSITTITNMKGTTLTVIPRS